MDEQYPKPRVVVIDAIEIMKCMCGSRACVRCGYDIHHDHSRDRMPFKYCPNCGCPQEKALNAPGRGSVEKVV